MPKFEVRNNCEYVMEVHAKDEDEAIEKANAIDLNDWDQQAWSGIEVELIDDSEEDEEC